MRTICFPDYRHLSDFAAGEIAIAIKNKPDLTLCMASGHTPALAAELLVKKLREEKIDYSRFTFFGLDEWVGLPPSNEGSCHYFFQQKIFEPLALRSSQYFLFNALGNDLESECIKMDQAITSKGGIDIMIVGIGMNGHIGFNEPGTPFTILSHVATLDEVTRSVGQKYFTQETSLSKGITIGPGHLMNSGKVILMANGNKKAEVIKNAVEGPVTPSFPASIIQQHKNAVALLDEGAASLLDKDSVTKF